MKMQDLQLVIEKAHAIRGEELSGEKAQDLAWTVLNHFGYSDRCLSNGLDQDENAVFCYLEDLGILKPESRVEILPESSMEWRIVQWTYDAWGIEKINRWTGPDPVDSLQDLYASLPPEAFAPDAGEDAPETPGEMTVQLVPEEGDVAVVNGGSEEMEKGRDVSEELRERIVQLGKEKVSQSFMDSLLKDLSGGGTVNGYGSVQSLVVDGFLRPDGDDGYMVRAEKIFRCSECHEAFPSRQAMMVHMKGKHAFDEITLGKYLAEGKTVREIMALMNRSKSTVQYHAARLRKQETRGEDPEKEDIPASEAVPAAQGTVTDMGAELDQLKAELNSAMAAALGWKKKFKEAEAEAQKLRIEADQAAERLRNNPAADDGVVLTSAFIRNFDGYFDSQRKMISEMVKDEIYHSGKGREIRFEIRQLPAGRKIVLTVEGGEGGSA